MLWTVNVGGACTSTVSFGYCFVVPREWAVTLSTPPQQWRLRSGTCGRHPVRRRLHRSRRGRTGAQDPKVSGISSASSRVTWRRQVPLPEVEAFSFNDSFLPVYSTLFCHFGCNSSCFLRSLCTLVYTDRFYTYFTVLPGGSINISAYYQIYILYIYIYIWCKS